MPASLILKATPITRFIYLYPSFSSHMQDKQESPAPAARSFLPGDRVWLKDHRSGKWLHTTVLSRLGSLTYSVQCLNVVRHVHLDHIIAYEFDLMD